MVYQLQRSRLLWTCLFCITRRDKWPVVWFGIQVPGRVDDLWLPHRQCLATGHQTLWQPAEQPNLPETQSDGSHA